MVVQKNSGHKSMVGILRKRFVIFVPSSKRPVQPAFHSNIETWRMHPTLVWGQTTPSLQALPSNKFESPTKTGRRTVTIDAVTIDAWCGT